MQESLLFPESQNENSDTFLGNLPLQRPLVFFDLETTGLDQQNDRIVQFAFLKVNPDKTQEEWMELVNPGMPIPVESSRVHHITDDMVADKQQFSYFAPLIYNYLENCDLCGFNIARFDVPFLQQEMTRNGNELDLNKINIVDAQVIFHKKEPRDLAAAYQFYCGAEHEDAHDAMGDVRVTASVFDAQMKKYDDLPKDVAKLNSFSNRKDNRFVTQDRKFYWRNGEAVLAFGKFKSKSLQWLKENQPAYLHWILNGEFPQETKELVQNALNGVYPKPPKAEN